MNNKGAAERSRSSFRSVRVAKSPLSQVRSHNGISAINGGRKLMQFPQFGSNVGLLQGSAYSTGNVMPARKNGRFPGGQFAGTLRSRQSACKMAKALRLALLSS